MSRWPVLAPLLLALALPLEAQAVPALRDTVLLDRVIASSDSGVVLHLRRSGVYRATVDPDVSELRLRSVATHGPATLVSRADRQPRGTWELYVMGDGDFVLTAGPISAGRPVHLRLIGDREAAQVLSERANHRLSLGLGATAGVHGAYDLTDRTPIAGAGGGHDAEVGIVFDGGHRVAVELGFSHQTIPAQGRSVEYVFAEPRARIMTVGAPAGRRVDLGLSFRYGLGNANDAPGVSVVDPSIMAPGLFATTHLSRRSGNRGWSTIASLYYGWLNNTGRVSRPSAVGASFGMVWLP